MGVETVERIDHQQSAAMVADPPSFDQHAAREDRDAADHAQEDEREAGDRQRPGVAELPVASGTS